MTLAIRSIAFPYRQFVSTTSVRIAVDADGNPLSGASFAGYELDTLVDIRGRHSDRVKIVENLGSVVGTATIICSFFDPTGRRARRRIHFNNASWGNTRAYTIGTFVVANSKLWECTIGGTSSGAGTGPTGSDTVVDGTVTWLECLAPSAVNLPATVQVDTIYRVSVYDVDSRTWVEDFYPGTWLHPALSYVDWLDLPDGDTRQLNPTQVLPQVHLRHVDLDSPPADVADLARIYDLTGGL